MRTLVFKDYFDAMDYALNIKWKVVTCKEGESCWCRVIEPVELIKYDNEDFILVSTGTLSKTVVEHLVKVHNEAIDKLSNGT